MQIGDQVPIATQQAVASDQVLAPIVNAISFRETGVLLSIIPRVADDGRILLDIEQEVSDAKETTTSDINQPTIAQRRIKTTVTVGNGGSVVLAGLMQDRATRKRQQVPLAGDIPLVGNLFKNKDDEIARTELMIAITPHIVNDERQTGRLRRSSAIGSTSIRALSGRRCPITGSSSTGWRGNRTAVWITRHEPCAPCV